MNKQRALSTLKRMKHAATTHDERESLNIAIQYLKLHLNSEYGQLVKNENKEVRYDNNTKDE